VSGHELSEMLTDPQLNAWYDQRGSENSDKCAWTFSGTVAIGGDNWKIQGNWSNAAANTNSGYGQRRLHSDELTRFDVPSRAPRSAGSARQKPSA